MAPAQTVYPVQSATDASHPSETLAVPRRRVRRRTWSARKVFERLLAAVVNGSYHPCWRTGDVTTQLSLLPPRDQNRLLESGRVTIRR